MRSEEFKKFMQSVLSKEKFDSDNTLIFQYGFSKWVAVKKDQINLDNRIIFRNYLRDIPRIKEGLCYKDLCNMHPLFINDFQAPIVQAVGCVLGVWDLVDFKSSLGVELANKGMMPMNTGLRY